MKQIIFTFKEQAWTLGDRPRVMGIVNVTPDSFSDGGDWFDPAAAVVHGLSLAAAGADLLDIGGESTRPGAATVTPEEEIRRVVPVIRDLQRQTTIPLSIDTRHAAVARAALEAGAVIVNDISGLHGDPAMAEVVRESKAGLILMHMRGTPDTMQQFTTYADLIGEIFTYFRDCLAQAEADDIPPERIMLDPGIGFSKTAEQNLELIRNLGKFRELGRPVLAGPSRKSFIGKILAAGSTPPPPKERIWGTAAAVTACVLNGADVIRVHDVREMVQVIKVATALRA